MHAALLLATLVAAAGESPIEIGDRRELFVDRHLIHEITGGARLDLKHPTPREVVMVHDAPWEGSGSGYHSIFRDGDKYRMYYKAWQLTVQDGKLRTPHPLVACYAESKDGIHWKKPSLGIVEFDGSKENNIILDNTKIGNVSPDAGHIAVFRDANPKCDPQARYKAIVRSRGPKGLLVFGSADGLHWSPLADKPVITQGAFDSQNLALWDSVGGEYRAFFRDFRDARRDIRTAVSKDFLTWSEPQWLEYPGAPKEQLYTNQIKPYYRAPHIMIGFPTRYIDRRWSDSMRKLPEPEHRDLRASASRRYGTALTEGLLMSSRDGRAFHRWPEAFLRPGPHREGSWAYGDNYIAWHVVETASYLPGAPPELSLYASEGYWTGRSNRLRRYTLRLDGFVSVRAPLSGGELVTKSFTFAGDSLEINFSTSAAGSIRLEMQDAEGNPLKGFALADCPPVFGDELERMVSWKGEPDLGDHAGKPVRLRFVLKDADLYSFRFRSEEDRK